MPFAEGEYAVGELGAGGGDEPFGVGVRARALWWDLADADAGVGEHGVEGGAELPCPVSDQDCELVGAVTEVHKQVPGLLGGPRPVPMYGDADDVHVAGADLEDEEHVQALQRERAVHMEEVAGEHRGSLRAQESPPCGAVTAYRRWWYPQLFEDLADGGGADAVSEAEQFALDSLVAPAGIVPGRPLDQTGDGWVDWRATGPVRVGPVVGHEPSMPGQDGGQGDEPMTAFS
ncbi:hypothetical protein [Micromonospora sp. DT47]|uniref:hypothetical protein n=1 Tax=Micromonospora sp. DT47 TaxID=3393431 RepID=UPI003CF49D94